MRRDNTVYMREYRQRPGVRERDRWWNSTRAAAMERLAAEHPVRFAEILAEIRQESSGVWRDGSRP